MLWTFLCSVWNCTCACGGRPNVQYGIVARITVVMETRQQNGCCQLRPIEVFTGVFLLLFLIILQSDPTLRFLKIRFLATNFGS